MRVVREVLRLTFAGISKREVARRTGLASSTVRATIARFQSLGLTWPLPETVTDSHPVTSQAQGLRLVTQG